MRRIVGANSNFHVITTDTNEIRYCSSTTRKNELSRRNMHMWRSRVIYNNPSYFYIKNERQRHGEVFNVNIYTIKTKNADISVIY